MPSNSPTPTERDLREHAASIKRRFLRMYRRANAGHVGSSLSCAELLTAIRFAWFRPGDRLVLSKGHAAAALYALLEEAGDLTAEEIATFYVDGTRLGAHPPPQLHAVTPFATGSLGHGLSLAAGLALGARLSGRAERVFCVSSDGELNEGSTWEAALFAAHHRLDNLIWLIDRNGLQGFGPTEDVLRLEPLAAKLTAFGGVVETVDGHDFASLDEGFQRGRGAGGLSVLLCRTVKGRGTLLANTVDSHYLPMSEEHYQHALREIERELASEPRDEVRDAS